MYINSTDLYFSHFSTSITSVQTISSRFRVGLLGLFNYLILNPVPSSHSHTFHNSMCLLVMEKLRISHGKIMPARGKKRQTNVGITQKKIDRCEQIRKVGDECLWSFHCTMVTDQSLNDELTCYNIEETERKLIYRPSERCQYTFIGALVMPGIRSRNSVPILHCFIFP